MRINKTLGNLQTIWNQLDNACGELDNAFSNLNKMIDLPHEIQDNINQIDLTAIVSLKNKLEDLINKK